MSKKTKIALSICLFTIVAVVTVGGIFAALSQTFNISNSIKFTGIDRSVNASVSIFVENNGTQTYSYPETTITDGMEIEIDDQTFSFEGVDQAEIDYYINIKNNSTTNNLRVNLDTHSFLEKNVSSFLTKYITYQIDEEDIFLDQSRGILFPNEEYTITLTLIMDHMVSFDSDFECPFTLETTTEERQNMLEGTDLKLYNYKTEAVVGENIYNPFGLDISYSELYFNAPFWDENGHNISLFNFEGYWEEKLYMNALFKNSSYLNGFGTANDLRHYLGGSPYMVVYYISDGSEDERRFTSVGQATITAYVLYDSYENWACYAESQYSRSDEMVDINCWYASVRDGWYYDYSSSAIADWLTNKGITGDRGTFSLIATTINEVTKWKNSASNTKTQTIKYEKFTYNVVVTNPELSLTLEFPNSTTDKTKIKEINLNNTSISTAGNAEIKKETIDINSYNYSAKDGVNLMMDIPDGYIGVCVTNFKMDLIELEETIDSHVVILENKEKFDISFLKNEISTGYLLVGIIKRSVYEKIKWPFSEDDQYKRTEIDYLTASIMKYFTIGNNACKIALINFIEGSSYIGSFEVQGIAESDGNIKVLDIMTTDKKTNAYKNNVLYKYENGLQVEEISLNKQYLEYSIDALDNIYELLGLSDESNTILSFGLVEQEKNLKYYFDDPNNSSKTVNSNYVKGIPTKIIINKKSAGGEISVKLDGYTVNVTNNAIDLSTVVDGQGNTLLEIGQNMFIVEVRDSGELKEVFRVNLYLNMKDFIQINTANSELICMEKEEQKSYYLLVNEDDVQSFLQNQDPNNSSDPFYTLNENFDTSLFDCQGQEIQSFSLNGIYNHFIIQFTFTHGSVDYKIRCKLTVVKKYLDSLELDETPSFIELDKGVLVIKVLVSTTQTSEEYFGDVAEEIVCLEDYLWGTKGADWFKCCKVVIEVEDSVFLDIPVLYLPILIMDENVNVYLTSPQYKVTGNEELNETLKFVEVNESFSETNGRMDLYKGMPIQLVREQIFSSVSYPSSIHQTNGHGYVSSLSDGVDDNYYFEGIEGEYDIDFVVTSKTGNTSKTYRVKINYIDECMDWIDIIVNKGTEDEEIIEGTFDYENFKFSNATLKCLGYGYMNMTLDVNKVSSAIDMLNGTITLSLDGNGYKLFAGYLGGYSTDIKKSVSFKHTVNEIDDYVFRLEEEEIFGETYYYFSFGFVFWDGYEIGGKVIDVFLLDGKSEFDPLLSVSINDNEYSIFIDYYDDFTAVHGSETWNGLRSYIEYKNIYEKEVWRRGGWDRDCIVLMNTLGSTSQTDVKECVGTTDREITGFITGAYVYGQAWLGLDVYGDSVSQDGDDYYINVKLSTSKTDYIADSAITLSDINLQYNDRYKIGYELESDLTDYDYSLKVQYDGEWYFVEVIGAYNYFEDGDDYPLFYSIRLNLEGVDEYLASQAQ